MKARAIGRVLIVSSLLVVGVVGCGPERTIKPTSACVGKHVAKSALCERRGCSWTQMPIELASADAGPVWGDGAPQGQNIPPQESP